MSHKRVLSSSDAPAAKRQEHTRPEKGNSEQIAAQYVFIAKGEEHETEAWT